MDINTALTNYFNINYLRDFDDRKLRLVIPDIGLEMYIAKNIWDQILCLNNEDYLSALIKMISRNIMHEPVEVVVNNKTNIKFTSANNCIIYIDDNTVLDHAIYCVYASTRSMHHQSFAYLDYEVLYDNSAEAVIANSAKIYLPNCIKPGNKFTDVIYIYGVIFHDVNKYIRDYNILCFMTTNMIILNKDHYLYDDLMQWLSTEPIDIHLTNIGAYIFTEDSLDLFVKADVHKNVKLIKNAYK